MKQRIDYGSKYPDAMKGLIRTEKYLANSPLDRSLYELIKLRASQINGCAYCLDMHSKDARKAGESEQRIYGLNAWREAPYYTDKERVALEWTEAVTNIAQERASDELYERVQKYFDEESIVALTMAVIAINGWNRLAISLRTEAGTYQPPE